MNQLHQIESASSASLKDDDDTAILQHFLGDAAIRYVDVAMASAHRQVLNCWPLLKEMDAAS